MTSILHGLRLTRQSVLSHRFPISIHTLVGEAYLKHTYDLIMKDLDSSPHYADARPYKLLFLSRLLTSEIFLYLELHLELLSYTFRPQLSLVTKNRKVFILHMLYLLEVPIDDLSQNVHLYNLTTFSQHTNLGFRVESQERLTSTTDHRSSGQMDHHTDRVL